MNCPIHLGEIALHTERAAALPCGHVFCLPCITTCFDLKRAKSGPCPICKKPTFKKQIMPLFLQPKSPSSSPVKSGLTSRMTAEGQTHVRVLRQHLETFETNGGVDDAFKTCAEMGQFADCIAGTLDIEAKCLAEEVKAAATRLQDLVLPGLRELASVKTRAKSLEEANTFLKSTLHLKNTEIESQSRRRIAVEKELANIQMAKRLADDKASSLREALSVKSERLVDAENTIRDREELIKKKDADIKQYKRWASENKIKTKEYKAKIKELESSASLLEGPTHRTSPAECFSEDTIVDARPSVPSSMSDPNNQDLTESLERPSKRRRTDDKLASTDMKLDKSCFVTQPPPSFKVPLERRPKIRAASFSGLNITNSGHVRGSVALGSRQRMGKRG